MKNRFKRSLLPIHLVLFVDNFAFAITFAIFGPLFLNPSYGFISKGVSATAVNIALGATLAAFPLGQLIGAPLLGDIADRFGRKKSFYIATLGAAVGAALSGVSILAHSYSALVITRFITGLFSGSLSICLASIADLSPDEKTSARNFSILIITTGISWMLAILLGSYYSTPHFLSWTHFSVPFFVTAALFIFAYTAIFSFFSETYKTGRVFKIHLLQGLKDICDVLKVQKLRSLYLAYTFWILGWGVTLQWYNPFVIQKFQVATAVIDWSLAIVGITWMMGGYFLNRLLIRRWSILPLVVLANGLMSLLLLMMSFTYSFFIFALFLTICCIPAAFSWPNTMSLISTNAPATVQGKVMGISQSLRSISFVLGTLLGGITASLHLDALYYLATLALFLSFLILSAKYIRIKKATLQR